MQIKLFNIPLSDDGSVQLELNKFLGTNRVLEVEQKFFQNEKGGCWSFCVRYISNSFHYNDAGKKIDYKEILNEQEFGIFAVLRDIRKQLAVQDAVPAYAIFTDEELAGIAKLPVLEVSKLLSVKGIGDKKVQKYGKTMLEIFHQRKSAAEKNETGK